MTYARAAAFWALLFLCQLLAHGDAKLAKHSVGYIRTDSNSRLRGAAGTRLAQHQEVSQPAGDVTTTHENFFQRMGNAFLGVIVGIIMMYFSVPVLWLNEKRNAKYEALIEKGEADCRSISADNYDTKNNHWLVHATGNTSSTKPVKDPQFNVRYDSGVIRISSIVEVYQYEEVEKSETKEEETLGGGKTTKTRKWKEYPAKWLASYDSGAGFENKKYMNKKPEGIEAGRYSQTCERVEFGQGFILGEKELGDLSSSEDAEMVEDLICEKCPKLNFVKAASGYWCLGDLANPKVGDVRVCFTVLRDGPATVLGLQAEGSEKQRGGFLPYRVIRRPPCPCLSLSEEEEKERLVDEARKSASDINDEDMWHGFMACCCCGCNIVQLCCGGMMPEILDAFCSSLSKDEAFSRLRTKASVMKWVIRLVGWCLMFFGLCLIFGPFTTALKLFPFGIGSFLSSIGSAIVFVFSFMVTLVISSAIVALAYSIYHPVVGIMASAIVAAIIAGILVFCQTVKA